MAKLGIPVKKEVGTPSRTLNPCNVDAEKYNSRRSVSPLARSVSKEPTSKAVETGGACNLPIVMSPEIAFGSRKPLQNMRNLNMYVIWADCYEINVR